MKRFQLSMIGILSIRCFRAAVKHYLEHLRENSASPVGIILLFLQETGKILANTFGDCVDLICSIYVPVRVGILLEHDFGNEEKYNLRPLRQKVTI
jgi:hypothetical protein